MISWHIAYRELAELLNKFYILNGNASGLKLYQKGCNDIEFVQINNRITKFYDDFKINSIDPIHVFASLNESGLGDSTRLLRLNNYFKLLESEINYKEIDYTGCPAPFSLKIMAARKGEIQLEIWDVFSDIVRLGQEGLNQGVFDKIRRWYGIEISSFTMFLFWIDSENFLPIDKNTNKFLIEKNIYKKRPRSYNEYKILLPKKNSDLYRKTAMFAYNPEGNPVFLSEYVGVIDTLLDHKIKEEKKFIDFKLLAIKTIGNTDIDFLKVLKPDNFFVFYNCYDFKDETKIKYDAEKDFNFYNLKEIALKSGLSYDLDINISAIVGKNGSGKSSITELLYMAINNFTYKVLGESSDLTYIKNLHLELYYHTDTIYRLKIDGDNLSLVQFTNIDSSFEPQNELEINKDSLENFFYTIAINYSHFALNCKEIGDWINELFYKNDGYQVPIVINPMRTNGNIDINLENSFVKSRMLANILEPIGSVPPEKSLRQIIDNKRVVKELSLSLNLDKIKYLYKDGKDNIIPFPSEEDQKNVLKEVYDFFKISVNNENEITDCANKYIYKKLITISKNYPKRYFSYYNDNLINLKLLNEYLIKLNEDSSHITYKLRQAINFLKYDHLKYKDLLNKTIDINQLSNDIQKVIENEYSSIHEIRTIELIPPSFFKVDIILSDDSSFDKLSSGEKQRIHSINSLVYHLTNLDSVYESEEPEEKNVKYSYVNILFDEIELYFHPDMQRTFISYLINYLEKIKFDYIDGLNICFITHSPFILSDIPSENVMFLKKEDETDVNSKSIQIPSSETSIKTFGANIHELLATGFFLDNGFMGEFAKEKILSLCEYLSIDPNSEKYGWKDYLSIMWTKSNSQNFINILGEPIIKDRIQAMHNKKFLTNRNDIEQKMQELQIQLNKLDETDKNR